MSDLSILFYREEEVRRWRAESENASARLELAQIRKRMAFFISQHEPLHGLNLDREAVRKVFTFIERGTFDRTLEEAT